MDFVLSLINDEQKMLRDTVVKLCKGKLKELDDKAGETNVVNREILQFLGRAGSLRVDRSRQIRKRAGEDVPGFLLFGPGGAGPHLPQRRTDFHHAGAGSRTYCPGRQRGAETKYLPPVAAGKSVITFALTEPSGGTDAAASFPRPNAAGTITF